jgi:tetratricopeptide (TPR) repeat protein
MVDFKFCENCGRKVSLNGQFCAGCGATLGAKEKSVQAPTQKASAAAPVKKETAPTQLQGLTAKEWSDKGIALYLSGRLQEALPCFDKALAINPQHAGTWANKALAPTIKLPPEGHLQLTLARELVNVCRSTIKVEGGVEISRSNYDATNTSQATTLNNKDDR